MKAVWNIKTMCYYGSKVAAGEKLPKTHTDIHDDPHQMGGDFIINKQGKLVMVYKSKMPSDRPPVDLILSRLQ